MKLSKSLFKPFPTGRPRPTASAVLRRLTLWAANSLSAPRGAQRGNQARHPSYSTWPAGPRRRDRQVVRAPIRAPDEGRTHHPVPVPVDLHPAQRVAQGQADDGVSGLVGGHDHDLLAPVGWTATHPYELLLLV